jgi:hypothetical protein
MKLKALDDDIKFDPGGTSYESVNLFEWSHEKVLVFFVFLSDTVIKSLYILDGE